MAEKTATTREKETELRDKAKEQHTIFNKERIMFSVKTELST